MENNNILQSPDINNDWIIDKNDVNELIEVLDSMTFNEKKIICKYSYSKLMEKRK
jgi:hypothetical protein